MTPSFPVYIFQALSDQLPTAYGEILIDAISRTNELEVQRLRCARWLAKSRNANENRFYGKAEICWTAFKVSGSEATRFA